MSSDVAIVRIPDGGSEYHFGDKKPQIGDVLKRNGDDWVVQDVAHAKDGSSLVTLRPADKPT